MFQALNAVLSADNLITPALHSIGNAADEAGEQAVESAVQFGSFGSALDNVSDEAVGLAIGANQAEGQVDELGEEATESAIQLQGLQRAITGTSRSAISAEFAGLTGPLSQISPLATAATPALLGLSSALGGLAVAGGAAAAGIGALAFGGLQRKAEQMAASSAKLKSASAAMQQIFKNFGKRMKQATEPLQTVANTEFVMAGLDSAVELVGLFSESVADLAPLLRGLASTLGATIMQTAPDIFAELETTVRALAPVFRDAIGILEQLPAAIAFLRRQAIQLAPELGSVALSAINAAAAVAQFGTDILAVVLPATAFLLDAIGGLAGVLNALPNAVTVAVPALGALTVAMAGLSAASWSTLAALVPLSGTLVAIAGAISAPIVAIAALGAAIVGIITYFGWWDAILNTLQGTWNAIVGAVQWGINTMLRLYDALGILGPVLMPGIAILTHFGDIVEMVGGVLKWLAGVAKSVFSWIGDALSQVASVLRDVIGVIDQVTNAAGLDNKIKGEALQKVDLSGAKVGQQSGPKPPADKRGRGGQTTVDKSTHNYEITVDGSGKSTTQIARDVVAELEKEKRHRQGTHN